MRSRYMGEMSRREPRTYAPNRIRELRLAKGMTLEEVAAGVPGEVLIGTISKLERGVMGLTLDWMQDVARALDVQPQELIAPAPPVRFVKLLGSIAAGNWREAVEDPQGDIPVPVDVGGPRAFALGTVGDSMNRIVPEGAYVVIDPDDRDLHERKIYALANEDAETTFKMYFSSPARLEPRSTNPVHETIRLGHEPLHLIGRVTYAGLNLR